LLFLSLALCNFNQVSSKSKNLCAGTFKTLAISNKVSREIALFIFGASM